MYRLKATTRRVLVTSAYVVLFICILAALEVNPKKSFDLLVYPSGYNVGTNSRKRLSCETVHDFGLGSWLVREGYISWWQPASCLLSNYASVEATRAVLQRSTAMFIGDRAMQVYWERTCFDLELELDFHNSESRCKMAVPFHFAKSPHNLFPIIEHLSEELKIISIVFFAFGSVDTSTTVPDISSSEFVAQVENLVAQLRVRKFTGRIVFLDFSHCHFGSNITDNTQTDMINSKLARSKPLLQARVHILSLGTMTTHCLLSQDERKHNQEVFIATISQIFLNIWDKGPQPHCADMPTVRKLKQSCALVSTAGYLTKFRHGMQIDAADFVIRSGVGPTDGFEDMVGSRTDLRILRHSVFEKGRGNLSLPLDEQTLIIYDETQSVVSPLQGYQNRKSLLSRKAPFLGFHCWGKMEDKKHSKLIACMNTTRQSSSGLWAVVLLYEVLDLCDRVELYGFLGHLHPQSEYHYFRIGLKNESAATSEVYDSRTVMVRGHLFKREQECFMHFSREYDAKADKLIL